MIIINVFASLNSGGAENRTMDVFRNIDKSKYQFHFISTSLEPNQYFEKEIIFLGGKIIKIPSPRQCGIFNHIKDFIKIFKQYDPATTIVHSHTLYHSGIVLFAAKQAKIRIRIAHARASQSSSNGLKNEIFIQLGKWLISRYATHKLAVSTVAGRFLFGKSNFHIIPNAIDINRYINFSPQERGQYRKEFHIGKTDFIFGHIGRLEKEKNHEFLLQQFQSFQQTNPQSKLILIGDGTLHNHILKRISEMNLNNSVILCGIRRDANRIINLFDIILFPSLFEGMPGVILEAQAAGIPCILSTNITKEVDLGLGLVRFLPLNKPQKWIQTIQEWEPIKTTVEQRKRAFDIHNLSIASEIRELIKIYNS